MLIRSTVRLGIAALLAIASITAVQAAEVSCGNAALGIRVVTIDPALDGGLCHAVNGNLDPLFTTTNGDKFLSVPTLPSATSLKLIGKEKVGDAADDPLLGYTIAGDQFGTWSVAASAWTSFDRLFLGFHFGGGGDKDSTNPDSFVIELAAMDTAGDWALTGPNAKLTGLSNVYLFATEGPGRQVPEPGTLALAGVAILGALALRRSKR